ncbi:MAG: PTS sugar transporter subunit IIA [Gammaproteobacteria bacterium]|nr:PTS sugar transporter subunit IIA [Gammaproteobacteria bacterium]
MFPENFLIQQRIALDVEASSKKRVLELLAELLHSDTEDSRTVFDQLLERERLGSTGMGQGIALPHARVQGLSEARGGFVRLAQGVDFGAVDGAPVDLIFALLVPSEATQAHLQLLARLAGLFRDAQLCSDLRQATQVEQVLARLLAS